MTDYPTNSIMVSTSECSGDESHACKSSATDMVNLEGMVSTVTDLRALPSIAFHSLIIILSISLLTGSYFKSILYRSIHTEKFRDRPINVLILVDAVVYHFCTIFWGTTIMVSVCFTNPPEIFFSETYCYVAQAVGIFGLGYLAIGGTSIAIFRLCYIRYNRVTKYLVGTRRLLAVLLIVGLTLALLLTVLFLLEPNNKRPMYNECIGQTSLAQSIIDEFNRREGRHINKDNVAAL